MSDTKAKITVAIIGAAAVIIAAILGWFGKGASVNVDLNALVSKQNVLESERDVARSERDEQWNANLRLQEEISSLQEGRTAPANDAPETSTTAQIPVAQYLTDVAPPHDASQVDCFSVNGNQKRYFKPVGSYFEMSGNKDSNSMQELRALLH